MKVIKRNGTEVEFDVEKIVAAISKANNETPVHARISTNLILAIAEDIQDDCLAMRETPTVEDIQDMVEAYLIRYGAAVLAKIYIQYRFKRAAARDTQAVFFNAIGEKLRAENVQNQNANLDEHSFSGRIGEATDVMTKKYALDYLVSPKSRYNHVNNIIYIHK